MKRHTIFRCASLFEMVGSVILAAFAVASLGEPFRVLAQENPSLQRLWAILVQGPDTERTNDTALMYHILLDHYNFTDIYYLHTSTADPRVDNTSTKGNVRWAINTWLPTHSGANDTIFVYFLTHGGGYQAHDLISPYGNVRAGLQGGRWDFNDQDEMGEHLENTVTFPVWTTAFPLRLHPFAFDVSGDGFDDVCRNVDDDVYIEIDYDNDGTFLEGDELQIGDYDFDGTSDDLLIDSDWDDRSDLAINSGYSLTSDGEDSDNDGYFDGVDVNEDGDQDDYIGIDECLKFSDGKYWDDEIRSDLNNLEGKYGRMVLITQSCVDGNLSCFGGGLIDDLSHENRIIMTASNETSVAHADIPPKDGYNEWMGFFMEALHGAVDADSNMDGHVSMKEAWDHAWEHDRARQQGLEIPWLDDNGNRLPTFANGTDVLDTSDGTLAANTWFPKTSSHLKVEAYSDAGEELQGTRYWMDGNQTALLTTPRSFHVSAENHTIQIETPFFSGWRYDLRYWNIEGTYPPANPIAVDASKDLYLAAYYKRTGYQGCPFVCVWNGTEYVIDNNLIPAAERSEGSDVTDYYMLQQMLAQKADGTYSVLLSEFENEHDFVDRVQLIAVDHLANVSIAVSPYGEILTYTTPSPPVSAIDNEKRQVKNLINSIDGDYYAGYNGSYIDLNFGELDVSQGAKLLIRSDPPDDQYLKYSIHIQVQNPDNSWNDVATIIPRRFWSTDIIDMSNFLPDAKSSLKVRLHFTANHRLDFVGLDTSEQAPTYVCEGQLTSAIHSSSGSVLNDLLYNDDAFAELVPGQSVELTFTLPQQTMERRNYIIIIEGHYYTI